MQINLNLLIWSGVTLATYFVARAIYRALPRWWTSPLLITWIVCGAIILGSGTRYADYFSGTRWMVWLLGPATVAFAIPIHRQRRLLQKHWPIVCVGAVGGSALALVSGWALARLLDFSPMLQASFLPRSVTAPMAMPTSTRLGGQAELTVLLTSITGLFGSAIGQILLSRLSISSAFARGAALGMAAHGAGVAKARELGEEEGVIASLTMIFAGLFTVLIAAVLGRWL